MLKSSIMWVISILLGIREMGKTTVTKRQKRALHTREKILNAALTLMQKQGIEQTTISEICKKAKVSVGSFYVYFKSKGDVLSSVYKSADLYFEETVAHEIEGLSDKEKILCFFRHYADYNYNTGLSFTTYLYFNSEHTLFLDKSRYMHVLLEEILSDINDRQRLITDLSPQELADFFFLLARGIVADWCLNNGGYKLDEKMSVYFDMVLKGCLVP